MKFKINTDTFSFVTASLLILLSIIWLYISKIFACKPNEGANAECAKPSFLLYLPSIAFLCIALFLLFYK